MQSCSRKATVRSQSRSDCFLILLNMQSHSREATITPRRRGEAASLLNFQLTREICPSITLKHTDREPNSQSGKCPETVGNAELMSSKIAHK